MAPGELEVTGGTAPPQAKALHDGATCERISELLSRVGDKWTVLVVRILGGGPVRFNALRRQVGDISQKMLATTLRNLERDGFVTRTVTPSTPPQVEYALTDLGLSLLGPVCALATWTAENAARIEAARRAFAARTAAPEPLNAAAGRGLSPQ
jgi:DNA-binding HxlR family transcriptional regulator